MSNFSYVIDSTFSPFSMQEMLVPFTAYKDAFEKSEEQYDTLSQNADKFKYLSETLPEGSKARQLYEGYANELSTQAEDLAHNGLTMGNRRALTSLKRRYQGEIGRLVKADEAMAEEKKLRQAMGAQDSSRLYATDNLNIDDFLDGKSPNLYSISGKEAYSRGAAAGKAFSSRVVNVGEGNVTLGGYYRDMVAKYGYSPEVLNNFISNMDTIPELKASFENYMESSGANANLSGANKQRFAKEYLSGVLDGAVYQENHSPQRDLGVLTKAEQVADTRAQQAQAITMWQNGVKWDSNGNIVGDENNINYQTKKIAADAAQAQFNTMYIEDPNNKGSYILNPDYASGYSLDPKGNWRKSPKTDNTLEARMSELKTDDLANSGGFSDSDGKNVTHYTYKAAMIKKGDSYKIGEIGKDIANTWGTWGIGDSKLATSMTVGLFGGGDYKVPIKSNSLNMRVLTDKEVAQLPSEIRDYVKANVSTEHPYYQIVEVPRENGTKDYLLAIAD